MFTNFNESLVVFFIKINYNIIETKKLNQITITYTKIN